MENQTTCPVCSSDAYQYIQEDLNIFYECPVCGRFELPYVMNNLNINRNHLASYLAYHHYCVDRINGESEYRYHTFRNKEWCDKYSEECDKGNIVKGHPVHMDTEIIEAWYPKTFSERVDHILLYVANHTKHIGQKLNLSVNCLLSVLFVDWQEFDQRIFSQTKGQWIKRNNEEIAQEADYVIRFLEQTGYIEHEHPEHQNHTFVLTPEGYERVDELQKNTSNGRSVLVAMSFNNTSELREAIRKGITTAGYEAVFIDEVQHNDFITPELLKHIKDSKFVVVDLTHQNNGAYFEEGYAMGLGKPVIQLCKRDVKLHFDIAQKNTIMWESEDDIPEKLCNRIKATIG